MSDTDNRTAQAHAVTRHLEAHSDLLRAVLAELRVSIDEVAVTDVGQSLILENWPVPGAKRAIAQRIAVGSDSLQVSTTGAQVLSANEARIGGMIVNYGTFGVILYLTDATAPPFNRPGRGAVYLAANGGAWDLRLGNVMWCGNIAAVAQGGSTTLTVCET